MKSMGKFLMIIAVTIISLLLPVQTNAATNTTNKVCIDPGHGGTDTGTTMTGANGTISEAQENLIIANDLNTLLTGAGYQTVMTRTDNTTLTNSQRATICNNANANLLISVHLNGSTNNNIDYTEVLYGKPLKDKAWVQVVDNSMANLPSAIGTGTITNKGITNFADGVLIKANMPAALAETVFITNTSEYRLLTDGTEVRQQNIAQLLDNAVVNWFAGK